MTDTDWIKPGAEVVVYQSTDGPHGSRYLRKSTVARVAKTSFSVDGIDGRFRLDTLSTKEFGGTTGSWWRYVAVSPDSNAARQVIAKHNHLARQNRAEDAVVRWRRNKTEEHRLAAIAALEALEEKPTNQQNMRKATDA
jgi:hypothetical protein